MCNLAVAKHCRNQGLAQKMIRTCEESVKGWQEDRLFLKVRESNQPALKLYEKLGYEIAETQLDIKTNHRLLVMKRAWGNSKEDQRDVDTALIREGSFERRSI
jgi:ribosomal protein S18 acetylase RimI-like enzyme